MPRTFVIAEAGSTHGNDLNAARALIFLAKQAGADAIKFQYWSNAERLATRRGHPEWQATYVEHQLPMLWIHELATYADALGIEWMCTTYLPEDIPVVAPYVNRFKVSSFECSDMDFIADHLEGYSHEVIISTGMADVPTLTTLQSLRNVHLGVSLLHCVSRYPAPLGTLALGKIASLDGFSDHSGDVRVGAWAVIAGAQIVEVHMRLDETPPTNPDYPHSHAPDALRRYIQGIRDAERAL